MQELKLFKVHKISMHLYCNSHIGGQKNAHQPIFPHSIIVNFLTSWATNSAFEGPNDFKFSMETYHYDLTGHNKIWGN